MAHEREPRFCFAVREAGRIGVDSALPNIALNWRRAFRDGIVSFKNFLKAVMVGSFIACILMLIRK
jgi:hypothetical protein